MKFKVTLKPIDSENNSRIIYLEVMILLIMFYTGSGNEKKTLLLKIHLLLWALNDSKRQNILLESLDNDCNESIGFWTIDLKNNSILTYMVKDELCGFNKDKYFLTEKGLDLIKNIMGLDTFEKEQTFLKKIGKRLNDKKVKKLKSLWS